MKCYRHKVCKHCGIEFKPKSGSTKYCDVCRPLADKLWRDAHREERASYNKQYRKEHCKERNETHNREKASRYRKKWRHEHPEKTNIYNHNRRAQIHGNGGSYTYDEEMELFAWQRGDCYYCGEFLYLNMPYHVDHKTPISRGGSNNIENIALACPKCNLRKNNRTAEEFLTA